jgi:hypothetical protein
MATPDCWRFSGRIGGICRFPREQCGPASVDLANNFAVNNAVNNMSPDDGKRAYRKDMLLASAMVAAGLAIAGLSLAEIKARNPQIAQATQPLQSPPTPAPDAQDKAPAEAKPGGERPTTPAPEPARPDTQTQKSGATQALPPAPAEKTAPPIKER